MTKTLLVLGSANADLVVEVGGAGTLSQSVRAVRPGGTVAVIGVLAGFNPFAVLFESYRAVIYGSPDGIGPTHTPDLVALGILLVASFAFLGLCMIFFKRVEPDFAKVL